ncbi:MAG TPA: glutaredoxin family protein [Candidatus Acidoferrales bacterium]|jgi:glutaredoxin|nr:glutaredoxin family protein [Candidatus Acidoferrales bacterium]
MKKVSMYTLSTCPWCHKTKKYFTDLHIPFTYVDYDLADEATQAKISKELDAAGATGFPFVRIGDEVISGYQPDRFAAAMKS